MSGNYKNHLTTGEFAKLCGVNKRTLFHYNDIGLFLPAITDENGYRYYSYHQFDTFSIITILKELSVPLKDIKIYLNTRTPELLLSLAEQKINMANREIDKLNQIKNLLEDTIICTNLGLNADCDIITLENQEEEYMFLSTLLNEKKSTDHTKWISDYTKFRNSTQTTRKSYLFGAMLNDDNIKNGNFNNYSYIFEKVSNKNESYNIYVKPKGLYAVAYHPGSYDTIYRTYDLLLKFLEENGLKMGEFAYEVYLLDEISNKNEGDYITQITVEIEKNKR
jgi:DNA-binding transcriptional MerR regulator/effector-binding domain-containing protein